MPGDRPLSITAAPGFRWPVRTILLSAPNATSTAGLRERQKIVSHATKRIFSKQPTRIMWRAIIRMIV